jgi:hypothetical protein
MHIILIPYQEHINSLHGTESLLKITDSSAVKNSSLYREVPKSVTVLIETCYCPCPEEDKLSEWLHTLFL